VTEPLFERIREAAAEVSRRARHVRIDDGALEHFAGLLARERPIPPQVDPAGLRLRNDGTTLAFVISLDAINFGSGWFPHLAKPEGRSGYLTVAHALRERFERTGPWSARELAELSAQECARTLGQSTEGPAGELMDWFARALNDLGDFLLRRHQGRFAGPVEQAGGSAERLVAILAEMPLYRDVSRYQGFEVPFYKRAQITCQDLSQALGGRGLGAFQDLGQLTIFADNLVPHVLRMLGVLEVDPLLAAKIEAGQQIASGSEEEVELRAVALHAVERLVASCRRRGWSTRPSRLDLLLWSRGQSPKLKAHPRHRTRCTYY